VFLEHRHKVEIHQVTGRVVECLIDEMNRPRGHGEAALRIPPNAQQMERLFAGWRQDLVTCRNFAPTAATTPQPGSSWPWPPFTPRGPEPSSLSNSTTSTSVTAPDDHRRPIPAAGRPHLPDPAQLAAVADAVLGEMITSAPGRTTR
jgi:hypothetical protein